MHSEKFYHDAENKIWFVTGDLFRLSKNGAIYFYGRIDNQVKINGRRLELNEIQEVLNETNLVKEAKVLVKNNKLIACLCLEEAVRLQDIKEYIKERLPFYMLPKEYITLKQFPTTLNGKVDTISLLEMAE